MQHTYYQSDEEGLRASAPSSAPSSSSGSSYGPTSALEAQVNVFTSAGDDEEVKGSRIGTFFKVAGVVVVSMAFLLLLSNNGGTVGRITGFQNAKSFDETTDTSGYTIGVQVESPGYDQLVSLDMLPWVRKEKLSEKH